METTKADVLAVAPEFAPVCAVGGQDPDFANAFRLVGPLVDDAALGTKAPIAGAYRVAHFLAKTYPDLAGDARIVVRQKLGPLELEFASGTPADLTDLGSTKYGLAFLEIAGRKASARRNLGAMVI